MFIYPIGIKVYAYIRDIDFWNLIYLRYIRNRNLWYQPNIYLHSIRVQLVQLKSWWCRAKATSCRAAIRTAKGVVSDIGSGAAAKSRGLNELASSHEKNSERDVLNISMKKYNLSLPIQLTTINKSPGAKYEGEFCVISLRSWCQFFINFNLWHVLCGLSSPNERRERAILTEFWRRFKLWKPDHELWGVVERRGIDLSKTAPLVLHGDEGRGIKKGPFLVTSYHSYLGKGTSQANESRKRRPFVTMRLNYTGHTFSHRMLTAVLPKMVRDSEAFNDIINFITDDALDVINNGVVSSHGERYWMATLQIVGDWAWLVKAGNLFRSYSTVEKRPRGEMSNPKGVCHLCFAGMHGIPFEDFRPGAKWKTTLFSEGDEPWTSRPVFLRLPHEPFKEQAFFAYDIWHSFHLGMGKTFLGSTLALISEKMPGGSIDVRFQHLTLLGLVFRNTYHFVYPGSYERKPSMAGYENVS